MHHLVCKPQWLDFVDAKPTLTIKPEKKYPALLKQAGGQINAHFVSI